MSEEGPDIEAAQDREDYALARMTENEQVIVLHSSPMLHHPPKDDDRSGVTFWLPKSKRGLLTLKQALWKAVDMIDAELNRVEVNNFNATYDANARRRNQYTDEDVKEVQRGLYPSTSDAAGESKSTAV